jgi:excisionase family DNA binding protein
MHQKDCGISRKKKRSFSASDPWKTVESAASYLSVHPNYVRTLIHEAVLKAVRFGKGFLIEKSDLDQLLIRRKKFFGPYRRGTKPWVTKRHEKNRRAA